jgi:hypothetical protein
VGEKGGRVVVVDANVVVVVVGVVVVVDGVVVETGGAAGSPGAPGPRSGVALASVDGAPSPAELMAVTSK